MGADTKYHLDQMQRVDLRTVWPDFIREQLGWALAMKEPVCDLGL